MAKKEKVDCPQCGKRVSRLNQHLQYCTPQETENEPIKEDPTPVVTSNPSIIKLKFRQSIWVQINGVIYEGKEVDCKDIIVASEIVRIAKQAYGWDVLI